MCISFILQAHTLPTWNLTGLFCIIDFPRQCNERNEDLLVNKAKNEKKKHDLIWNLKKKNSVFNFKNV